MASTVTSNEILSTFSTNNDKFSIGLLLLVIIFTDISVLRVWATQCNVPAQRESGVL